MQSILSKYSDFFLFLSSLIDSFGLATMLLSLLATLLMIVPLRWAGKISAEESKIQAVIGPQLNEINTNKAGSEKHLSTNRLYSRYSYHPIYAIRSLMPLFIQLPYLVFTYFMFTGLQVIDGESFLWINNLAEPDQTFPTRFGNGNILPFLMLLINIAAAVLLVDFNRKNFIQAMAVSLLFFILLYGEPAILLLFWTFNNFLMLVRNVISYHGANASDKIDFRKLTSILKNAICSKEIILLLLFIYLSTLSFSYVFDPGPLFTFLLHLKYIGYVCLILSIGLGFYRLFFNKIEGGFAFPREEYSRFDILIALLPISFILQYAVVNQDMLAWSEALYFVSFYSLIIVGALFVFLPAVNKIIPTVGFFPFLFSLMMVWVTFPVITAMNNWIEDPDIGYLLAILFILFLLSGYLFYFNRKVFVALSALFFIVNTALNVQNGVRDYKLDDNISVDFSNFIPRGEMLSKPDIFLLTYDSYVAQETMLGYGIDNSSQESYLQSKGFTLYPHAYSIAPNSRSAMSRMLEMNDTLQKHDYLSTSGAALVLRILSQHGYETFGVLNAHLVPQVEHSYDYLYPNSSSNEEFVHNGLNSGRFAFRLKDQADAYLNPNFLKRKSWTLALDTDSPKFVYAHSGPGHAQFSGRCRSDETALFAQRLKKSNIEMKQDIETILSTKRDSIIIVNGDHGPYLTADCSYMKGIKVSKLSRLNLQDRYGSFLAIRWPETHRHGDINIRILQDTFEAVFSYLFQSQNILNNRPSTSITVERFGEGTAIPDSAVSDGIINYGIDKGEPLFESKPPSSDLESKRSIDHTYQW